MSDKVKQEGGRQSAVNAVVSGTYENGIFLDNPEIHIQTRKGTVRIDSPQTPAGIVQLLYNAIGEVERLYPNETPFPKVHESNR